jgi:hypothetical protein
MAPGVPSFSPTHPCTLLHSPMYTTSLNNFPPSMYMRDWAHAIDFVRLSQRYKQQGFGQEVSGVGAPPPCDSSTALHVHDTRDSLHSRPPGAIQQNSRKATRYYRQTAALIAQRVADVAQAGVRNQLRQARLLPVAHVGHHRHYFNIKILSLWMRLVPVSRPKTVTCSN